MLVCWNHGMLESWNGGMVEDRALITASHAVHLTSEPSAGGTCTGRVPSLCWRYLPYGESQVNGLSDGSFSNIPAIQPSIFRNRGSDMPIRAHDKPGASQRAANRRESTPVDGNHPRLPLSPVDSGRLPSSFSCFASPRRAISAARTISRTIPSTPSSGGTTTSF